MPSADPDDNSNISVSALQEKNVKQQVVIRETVSVLARPSSVMGRDVKLEEEISDEDSSDCGQETTSSRVYPLRPSLFPHVPPYVKFIPVSGTKIYFKNG